MMDISLTDGIGYIAMFFVAVSFIFKNLRTIRIVNMLGAVVFIVYGVMLDMAIPIIATNSFIIFIQLYYLLKPKSSENE